MPKPAMTRPNVSDPGRIVAHRGASRTAPENTLAAFLAARDQGAHWIEFDVSLLGDGTPVVHHDDRIDRCSTATGALAALGAADLAGLDMGSRHSAIYAGEPLPTLDATLELIGETGLWANLEIKPHSADPADIAGRVAASLAPRPWRGDRVLVSSFSLPVLAALRQTMPDQPLAMLWDRPPQGWPQVLETLSAAALHVNFRSLSDPLLREARRAGADLRVYTINDPDLIAPFRDGLTGVITDHPPLFLDDPAWAAWAEV